MPEIRIHQLMHNSRQTQRTYLLMCMWPVNLLMHTSLLLAIINNLRMLWHILDAHALRCILIVGLIHVRLHYYIRLRMHDESMLPVYRWQDTLKCHEAKQEHASGLSAPSVFLK